jgi:uncharacterized membrane protein YjfL (UPF0719 family)
MGNPHSWGLIHHVLCFAQTTSPPVGQNWAWDTFLWRLAQAVIYLIVGLAIFAAAYLIIDKVTPFSLRKELLEDKNYALAIVLGAVFISIAIILAAAIHG